MAGIYRDSPPPLGPRKRLEPEPVPVVVQAEVAVVVEETPVEGPPKRKRSRVKAQPVEDDE